MKEIEFDEALILDSSLPFPPYDGGEDDDADNADSKADDAAERLKKLEAELSAAQEEKTKLAKNNKALNDQLSSQREKSTELDKRLKEIEDAKEEERMKAQEAAGEISELNQSWQEKYDRTRAEYDAKIEKATSEHKAALEHLQNVVVDVTSKREAALIAADLALPGHQDVLRPHIEARLRTEWEDEVPIVKILGANGEASALTMDEFKDEIKNTDSFKPLLMGYKSSGGGNGANDGGPNFPGEGRSITRAEMDAMTVSQRSQFFQDPENRDVRVVD